MSESQAAVREICDAIIKRVDRAYVAECGRKNEFPQKLWDMWVDTGLLSMGLSEEFGGSGGSLKDIVLALDLLHQEALLLPIAVTNFMSREPIMHHATQAQKERYLPPTATGEEFFSFGITEADSGTNTFKIKTTAIRQPDGTFLLNGGKTYVATPELLSSGALIVVSRGSF
ncbi:acyl-CoA dehydrogenase [Pseudomonas extremaustralis]|uniref:acyl-CoA dehydrogenase family protein n=1 Tax=Pseudomonas extremaustralis TaxID=359110 RepID=UPI00099B4A83|nr:acyl-CoA dehydrogenase family protein [Pseudomonas extremaustralis]SKA83644.1 acyl-CoA dehydrogenase [Pseudomonas extremaustralis]